MLASRTTIAVSVAKHSMADLVKHSEARVSIISGQHRLPQRLRYADGAIVCMPMCVATDSILIFNEI